MAGFAGLYGLEGNTPDYEQVAGALAFTALETVFRFTSPGFAFISVTHAEESRRSAPIFRGEGLTVMLDGYITHIEGCRDLPAGTALATCARLYREEGPGFAHRLNGSLVLAIHDGDKGEVHLIADRLGSRNVYYHLGPGLFSFATRLEAIRRVNPHIADRVRESSCVELLSLGRLVDGCMLEGVNILPSSHALTYDGRTLKERRYWSPAFSYASNGLDLDGNARRLAGAMSDAVKDCVRGWDSTGLLLSGGLDSRVVLSCLDKRNTACYTICDRRNLETRVAERAAKHMGAAHVKLVRGADHYAEIIPEAARVCEGGFEYSHAHFEGLWDRFGRNEDRVFLSGYAMNSVLRSYYLPYLSEALGARMDHAATFQAVQSVQSFEERLLQVLWPSPDSLAVVVPRLRRDAPAYPREAIKRFSARYAGFIVSPVDLFELYVFGHVALGRTHPFLESLRQSFPERCPSFDNRLVAIALSTPPEQRFDSRVFRRALRLMDPRLALLVDANTFFPAAVGGSMALRGQKALKFVERIPTAIRKRLPRHGTLWLQKAGSWHDLGALWRWSDLGKRLEGLLEDEAAMRDGLIKAEGVRELLRSHVNGKGYHHITLARVLTFLEWRRSTA